MKRIVILLLALALSVGWGTAAMAEDVELRCGAFSEEIESDAWLEYIAAQGDDVPKYENEKYVMFDSLHQMLMALQADDIDYFYMLSASARYITAHASGLEAVEEPFIKFGYRMAMLPENRDLCERLSLAIADMKADGSLQALADKWLVPNADELEAVELPSFDDSEIIRVGITGDLPPIDYASVNGTPSGYNVVLLSALGQKLGVNFVLVSVSPGARLMALTSGRIDVMFWMENYQLDDEVLDLGEVLMSACYYHDIGAIVLKEEYAEGVKELLGLE